jgi:DNA-directed RNA polymerase subunit RPC12/RpoP
MENYLLEEGTLGFEPHEVLIVLKEYVCSVCHGELKAIQVPHSRVSVIICVEHGNVETCGRVMRSTVSIEIERGLLTYKQVVRNLHDLWPDLDVRGFEYNEAQAIAKHNVCGKCGGKLTMQYVDMKTQLIALKCTRCGGDIEDDKIGYKRRK